jgi:hypothetical protein
MGHAGRDYSQFAELRGGTLWRSDFVLRQRAPPQGDVRMEFKSGLLPGRDDDGMAAHEAVIRVAGVTVGNTRAMVMLPEGFEYVSGSATVDGIKVTDAKRQVVGAGEPTVSVSENVVIARLPFDPGWTQGRDFPAPQGRTFRKLYAEYQRASHWRRA